MTRVFRVHLHHRGRRGTSSRVAALGLLAAALVVLPESARSQQSVSQSTSQSTSATADAATVLQRVLPQDVATRILALAANARTHGLPSDALLQRALKFAARGIPAADIERSVAQHAGRLAHAKAALDHARTRSASAAEIEAGAEAIREGVDAGIISTLAKSAPSGRSLAVPLYVIGNLTALGLPAVQALARVQAKLTTRATDGELEGLPAEVSATAGAHVTGHGAVAPPLDGIGGAPKGGGSGPPAGVPGNGGAKVHLPPIPTPGNAGGGNGRSGHP